MSASDCAGSGCCDRSAPTDPRPVAPEVIAAVRDRYAAVASSALNQKSAGVRGVAQAFGYSEEDLASVPDASNMALSCGNPTAMASLRPGEVVVDLGCGGGLDVFLAARLVGPTGRAIGIDMTPEMIDRARRNAAGIANVEFHLATIDSLPLPDASVDCIVSNCVINLAPDKSAVLREAKRVLRPGGRLAVSDIALKRELPPELAGSVAAYVGCFAGALLISEYRRMLKDSGFVGVQLLDAGVDLHAYAKVDGQSGCCTPTMKGTSPESAAGSCCAASDSAGQEGVHEGLARLLAQYDVNDYAASVKILAERPR